MSRIYIVEEKEIDAPAEMIYGILSDYRVGHPAILPKQYFTALKVEEGGTGDGTIVLIEMNVRGTKRVFRAAITEPEPGRKLVESDLDGQSVTSFTVESIGQGKRSRVIIATQAKLSPGIKGLIESLVSPIVLRRIYRQELHILADYVEQQLSKME